MVIPPRVTMNGGRRRRVTPRPCRKPIAVPIARQIPSPISQLMPPQAFGSTVVKLSPLITYAAVMAHTARMEPTERSIPAVRMTKVIPTAMIP
jgi:hypothetical protein